MKNTKILIALCLAALLLAGCGGAKHEPTVVVETPEPARTQETVKPEPAPETPVQETKAEPETSMEPEGAFDEEKYAIALTLIGETVEDLYEAIGYPEYQDYGPSCLEPGAEDGQLDYAGFSVFTLVQDQVETITEVLKDDEF
jgi:hypothetical protein